MNICKKTLNICLCILAILCQFNLSGQTEKTISPKKLKKDFDKIIDIVDAHPDPYQHISEEDFKAKFDELRASLDRPHTHLEFYKKIATMISSIKDGHSSVEMPDDWLEDQRKKNGAFPYEVYLTNEDELYIIKSHDPKETVSVGVKILEINDIAVDSFLNTIDPFISYEKKPFRNTIIDDRFELYLYLSFGFSDQTKIKYLETKIKTATISNTPFKQWKKSRKNNIEEREARIKKDIPYKYEKLSDGVGLIRIYSFSIQDFSNYKIFLKKTFSKIRKENIHSLIIDVRGNYGGYPKVASNLFHYISNSYFKTMAMAKTKVSGHYRLHLFKRFPILRNNSVYIPPRRYFIDIDAIINNPINSFVLEKNYFNEAPETMEFEFRGDTYLLTDRDSYSAASSFASTFQCYNMGTIIGEETGGTKIFRANAIWDKLARSGIFVSISTCKNFTTCFNEELEVIKPDIKFKPTILDLSSGLDMHLLYAQRVIKKIQREKKQAAETEKP